MCTSPLPVEIHILKRQKNLVAEWAEGVVGLNEFLQMQRAEMTASRLTAFELKQTHEHLKVQFLSVST